jgi:hypothetical protein
MHFGSVRLEKACECAWDLGTKTRRSVESLLKHNLENAPSVDEPTSLTEMPTDHENLRGKDHYH